MIIIKLFIILVTLVTGYYSHQLFTSHSNDFIQERLGHHLNQVIYGSIVLVLSMLCLNLLYFFIPLTLIHYFLLVNGLILCLLANLFLPILSYNRILDSFPRKLLVFYALANLFFNSFFIAQGYNYGDSFLATFGLVFILNALVHGGLQGLDFFVSIFQPKTNRSRPSLLLRRKKKQDLINHYHEAGLSDEEIQVFRETMAMAKDHISSIQAKIDDTAKLSKINYNFSLVPLLQSYFRNIVQEPQRIIQADAFLYRLLPSLDDLIQKYNEINSHIAKNKQTYLILEKTAKTIQGLAEEINRDYIHFHQETFDSLNDELTYADRILNNETVDCPDGDIPNSPAYPDQDKVSDPIKQLLDELNNLQAKENPHDHEE